ncbi:hypothetical protein XaC1_263 [Xanthomonas phage XaC1]|nr:hypothetical protein XaC1_263 [Xanthomonas phage XaC1]
MVIKELGDDINPYICNDANRYALKFTHYTIDGTKYRDLQEKQFEKRQRLLKMAEAAGVVLKETNVQQVIERTEARLEYLRNKDTYDAIFGEALKSLEPHEIAQYLENHIKNKS